MFHGPLTSEVRAGLKELRIIGIWLLLPFAVVALPTDAPGLTCLAMIFLYAGGVCLALYLNIRFFSTRNKPHAAAAFLIVTVIWLLAWQYGFAAGARIHLWINQSRYEQKISELDRATSAEDRARICGDDCMTHYEARMVTFHYCHCPFNWPDLVYDPAGELEAHPNEPEKIGYLRRFSRVSKFWYIGYFGD